MNRNLILILSIFIIFSCRTAPPESPRATPPSLTLADNTQIPFYPDRADLHWTQFYPAKGFELQARTPMGTEVILFDSRKRDFLFNFTLSGLYEFKIRAITGDGGVSKWSESVKIRVQPLLTAVSAENKQKTLIIELHPDIRDRIVASVPGELLVHITDDKGNIYLVSSLIKDGKFSRDLLFSAFDAQGMLLSRKILNWPFGKQPPSPKSAGICLMGTEALAFTAWTDHAIVLFITDFEGNLLVRELLPDFLLGPNTNYREGKTDLDRTRAFSTGYQPVDNLLIIRGKAHRPDENEKNWLVKFDPEAMTFSESTLTEDFPPDPPLLTIPMRKNIFYLQYDSRKNLIFRLSAGDGGVRMFTIFRDREGFLSPVSLNIINSLIPDAKTLYLSAEFTENDKIYPVSIFIKPGPDGEPALGKVSVPDKSGGNRDIDLRIIDSSPFPDEKSLRETIQGKWKGLDESGTTVFFKTGKRNIVRIDYSIPGIGDGGFARWEILWKNAGYSQIMLYRYGDGGIERTAVWEIIGRTGNELVLYDVINNKDIYLYRMK